MSETINTTTINLSDYFFDDHDFNWKNVELTVEKWGSKLRGEEHLHLLANADLANEDEPQFWIEYENVELVFEVGVTDSVQWCPMNGAKFGYGESPTILPRGRNRTSTALGIVRPSRRQGYSGLLGPPGQVFRGPPGAQMSAFVP